MRALRRDSRATKPNPEAGAVEPRSERRSERGWSVCGREGSSDEIGGTGRKEGESEREAAEIHARRRMRMNLGREKMGNEVERTGRKEGEGNGGKHLGNEGGETRGEARIESWKGMSRGWNRSGDGEGGSDFSVVGK